MTRLAVNKKKNKSDQEDVQLTRPFEGVKILDFTQVLAGPYASYQLALLGADVIKVERREGEDMRRTPLSREWAERGLAPALAGDQRQQAQPDARPAEAGGHRDRQAARRAGRRGDGEFPSRRDGQARHRLCGALGDQSTADLLRDLRLRPDRPGAIGAGYDGKIQAMSGIMAITGHEETGPTRAGFAGATCYPALTAVFGARSALYQRTQTGKGQFDDASMLEATLAFRLGQVADYSVAGHRQQLSGNQAVSRRPTASSVGYGYLLLAVNSEKQYRALMTALGREDAL